ncbi:hypothetical protein, partial [Bacillus atrophaeus]|uniref:hypothetical protein n=1 Tax=Bacillus atrophaeus TaxID=1452 RepID=UPI00227DE002
MFKIIYLFLVICLVSLVNVIDYWFLTIFVIGLMSLKWRKYQLFLGVISGIAGWLLPIFIISINGDIFKLSELLANILLNNKQGAYFVFALPLIIGGLQGGCGVWMFHSLKNLVTYISRSKNKNPNKNI